MVLEYLWTCLVICQIGAQQLPTLASSFCKKKQPRPRIFVVLATTPKPPADASHAAPAPKDKHTIKYPLKAFSQHNRSTYRFSSSPNRLLSSSPRGRRDELMRDSNHRRRSSTSIALGFCRSQIGWKAPKSFKATPLFSFSL